VNWNLVGSIYGRSSIRSAHFVPIHLQTWSPQVILVFDWLISKKSSPLKLHGQMNPNLVGSSYGRSSIKIAISFSSVNRHCNHRQFMFLIGWCHLVGGIYGRSSIKIAHFVPIHLQTWPPHAILVSDWLISKESSPLKLHDQMNPNLVGSS
jgi:hypothetical protein